MTRWEYGAFERNRRTGRVEMYMPDHRQAPVVGQTQPDRPNFSGLLAEVGRDGWELAAVDSAWSPDTVVYWFKRPAGATDGPVEGGHQPGPPPG